MRCRFLRFWLALCCGGASAAAWATPLAETLFLFPTPGPRQPTAGLTWADDRWWGTTSLGGQTGQGAVFSLAPDADRPTVAASFAVTDFQSTLTADGDTLWGTRQTTGQLFAFRPSSGALEVRLTLGDFLLGGNALGFPDTALTATSGGLWGTTMIGGASNRGTLFRLDATGTGLAQSVSLAEVGHTPRGALVDAGGWLWGTTSGGGTFGHGTLFRANLAGTELLGVHHFTGADGSQPLGPLLAADGWLWGTTGTGGASNAGTIFRYRLDGTAPLETVHSFAGGPGGAAPLAGLTLAGDALWGTTSFGGQTNAGTLFRLSRTGQGFQTRLDLATTPGRQPAGSLALRDGHLWGLTRQGGARDGGIWLALPVADPSAVPEVGELAAGVGSYASHAPIWAQGAWWGVTAAATETGDGGTLYRWSPAAAAPTVLYIFDGLAGLDPSGPLTLDGDWLWGTCRAGGDQGDGTLWRYHLGQGRLEVVHSFFILAGQAPHGAPVVVGDHVWGTTAAGGPHGQGTVYRVSRTSGAHELLHAFGPTGAHSPAPGLTIVEDDAFGATTGDGTGAGASFFRLPLGGGPLATLFVPTGAQGTLPGGPPVFAQGHLWGLTVAGASGGTGAIVRFLPAPGGQPAVVHTFGAERPWSPLFTAGQHLFGLTTRAAYRLDPATATVTELARWPATGDAPGPFLAEAAAPGAITTGPEADTLYLLRPQSLPRAPALFARLVLAPTALQQWLAAAGRLTATPLDAPAADGLPLLVRWALDLPATGPVAGHDRLPQLTAEGPALRFRFRQRRNDPALRYAIEVAAHPAPQATDWALATDGEWTVAPLSADWELVTFTLPPPTGPAPRFIRLRLSR